MNRTLQIGVMCAPISKQLCGLISTYSAEMLDRDHEAINRCYIMGYLTDSATERARKRLIKKCQEAVSRHREGRL